VVSEAVLDFVGACQQAIPCHLAGGAALSGAFLGHRLSRDIDLFVHDAESHRELVRSLPEIARRSNATVMVLRDAASHVRARLHAGAHDLDLDLVHESLPDLDEPVVVESIIVESLRDLRASKLTCILSRTEPRLHRPG
jgi:hypothetical protein